MRQGVLIREKCPNLIRQTIKNKPAWEEQQKSYRRLRGTTRINKIAKIAELPKNPN
jgi:hypothetical protein